MATLSGYFEVYNKTFSAGVRIDDEGKAAVVLGGGTSLSNGYAVSASGSAVFSEDGWTFEGTAVDGFGTPTGSPVKLQFFENEEGVHTVVVGIAFSATSEVGIIYEYTPISGDDWNLWEFSNVDESSSLTNIDSAFYEVKLNRLFKLLDSSLNNQTAESFDIVESIFLGASGKLGPGAAGVLFQLEMIFGIDHAGTDATPQDVAERVAVVASVAGIADYPFSMDSDPSYDITSLANKSPAELAALTSSGSEADNKAVKYALVHLNSFALTGSSLYEDFDPDAIADQYENETYWEDRATFLATYLASNSANSEYYRGYTTGDEYTLFNDQSTGIVAKDYAFASDPKLVVFGGQQGGFVEGGANTDVLYGGQGSDTLLGHEQADQLYGGDGNDLLFANNYDNDTDDIADQLYGGKGDDIYYLRDGDVAEDSEGNDTYIVNTAAGDVRTVIRDTGRKGALVINNNWIRLGLYESANLWNDAGYELRKEHGSLLVAAPDGAVVEIKNFSDGDFGISLEGAPDTVSVITTDNTIEGDRKPQVNDDDEIQYDDWGNIKPDEDKKEADREDQIYDTDADDHILAGGGDDRVIRRQGGDDVIELGDGDDWLSTSALAGRIEADGGEGSDYLQTGSGVDVVVGGEGVDALHTGAGNDRLFGEQFIEFGSIMTVDAFEVGTGERGDILNAGDGNDLLIGSASNDLAAGGDGNDYIVVGAGDDLILSDWVVVEDSPNWQDWWFTNRFEVIEEDGYQPRFENYFDFDHFETTDAVGKGDDVIYAGAGNDVAISGAGDDLIYLGDGDDFASGRSGADKIYGGGGNDFLDGGIVEGDTRK